MPIDTAKSIIAELKAHGRVIRPYVGIQLMTIDQTARERLRTMGFKFESEGVFVAGVRKHSPADRAGFHQGDIIVAVNGAEVKKAQDVTRLFVLRLCCLCAAAASLALCCKSFLTVERSVRRALDTGCRLSWTARSSWRCCATARAAPCGALPFASRLRIGLRPSFTASEGPVDLIK